MASSSCWMSVRYSSRISFDGPVRYCSPFFSRMARRVSVRMISMSCVTKSSVVPFEMRSLMRLKQRFWKSASPTASASSTIRMSGSTKAFTANARRTIMPEEYVFTGWSMNSPMSANATMSSYFASVSAFVSPRIAAFMYTFSLPVNSGLNPLPSSSRAAIRPCVSTLPSVGWSVPVTICSRVDFPAPLRPMIPTHSPFRTSKSMSRRAQNSR